MSGHKISGHAGNFLRFFIAILLISTVLFSLTACENQRKPNFTVIFNHDTISNEIVESGEKLTKPSDPERYGYIFSGWFKDEELKTKWEFEKDTVTGNITLYPRWKIDTATVELERESKLEELAQLLLEYDSEDYLAKQWESLNSIITSATEEVENAQTVSDIIAIKIEDIKEQCNAIETSAQALQREAFIRLDELNKLRLEYEEDNYTSENWLELNKIISDAIDAVNEATSFSQLEAIDILNIENLCNNIPTYHQQLNTAVQTLLTEIDKLLEDEYLEENYSLDKWLQLTTIIENAKTDLLQITTLEELDNFNLNTVRDECDKVLTKDAELQNAKNIKLIQLDALITGDDAEFKENNYSEENWQAIITIIDNAKNSVNEASELLDLDLIVIDDIKEDCLSVATKEVQLENEKQSALSSLNNIKAKYESENYSAENWERLIGIIDDAENEITTAQTLTQLRAINLVEVEQDCDKVETKQFSMAKENLLSNLSSLLDSANEEDYTPFHWQQLDNIIIDAKNEVEEYTTMQQINDFNIQLIQNKVENNTIYSILENINNYMINEIYDSENPELELEKAYLLLEDGLTEHPEIKLYYTDIVESFDLCLNNNKTISIPTLIFQDGKIYIAGSFVILKSINGEINIQINELDLYLNCAMPDMLNCFVEALSADIDIDNQDSSIEITIGSRNQRIGFEITNEAGENILNDNLSIYILKEINGVFYYGLVKGSDFTSTAITLLTGWHNSDEDFTNEFPNGSSASISYYLILVGYGSVLTFIDLSVDY